MKVEKRGLIFSPNKKDWWQQNYAILPTPFFIEELDVIRVFFATTCFDNFGRLAYVDLDCKLPSKIINYSNDFILDVGKDGAFDDCGVNPSSIIKVKDKFFLYYAGYQRHFKTPYSILSGLAISDKLNDFERYQNTPILERTDTELSIRSAPSVIELNNQYYMVYVSDYGWTEIEGEVFKGKRMPQYCLKSGISKNGINWKVSSQPIFYPLTEDEFGFGRPFLYKRNDCYYLFYSIRRKNISYRIGYAVSNDNCKTWQRKDNIEGLEISSTGWDSEMICYPAVITVLGKTYLFYNGNNNGETGFGYAEIIEF
jgi:predicted GH43/DUF377 family glycosyl hydrolase